MVLPGLIILSSLYTNYTAALTLMELKSPTASSFSINKDRCGNLESYTKLILSCGKFSGTFQCSNCRCHHSCGDAMAV